jgi:acyl-CoA thioester hydrolase
MIRADHSHSEQPLPKQKICTCNGGASEEGSLYLQVSPLIAIAIYAMTPSADNSRALQVELSFSVRAYDIDAMGIVSNIVYVRWFEDLRTEFLERVLPLRDILAGGHAPILAHTDIHYRSPITIQDQPVGRVWVELLGRAKWRLGFEICAGDRVCCTGSQEGLFIDLATRKPVPVPTRLADAFSAQQTASHADTDPTAGH